MIEEMSVVSNKYLAYFPELSPTAIQKIHHSTARSAKIPAIKLFLAHYKAFPCLLTCPRAESNALFHIPSILNYLKTEFEHNATNDIIVRRYHSKSKQVFVA